MSLTVDTTEPARAFISGVLLAAGTSSRFAGDRAKQLAAFGGEPLVLRALEAMRRSRLDELIVVTGFESRRVADAVSALEPRIVENPLYSAGQSTSVRAGLEAVDPRASGACFVVCDQPLLDARTIDRLLAAFAASGAGIVLPAAGGRRGSPVIFARRLFPALAAIEGDEGGRQLVRRLPGEVLEVAIEDRRTLVDVDSREDLARLAELCSERPGAE